MTKRLLFTQDSAPYNAGEFATFVAGDERVRQLLAKRVAIVVDDDGKPIESENPPPVQRTAAPAPPPPPAHITQIDDNIPRSGPTGLAAGDEVVAAKEDDMDHEKKKAHKGDHDKMVRSPGTVKK